MSIHLMVEVLDYGPKRAADRLLLVALAEKADDTTRRVLWSTGENGRETLERRTGLSSDGLRKCFARLADAGLETRVPIGVDKHGQPVFAHVGQAAEYVIPRLKEAGTPVLSPEVESQYHSPASDPVKAVLPSGEARTTVLSLPRERRYPSTGHVPPSLEDPSTRAPEAAPLPATHRTAVAELLAKHGPLLDEARALSAVTAVASKKSPDDVAAYMARFTIEDVNRWAGGATRSASTPVGKLPSRKRCARNYPIASDGECCAECATERSVIAG